MQMPELPQDARFCTMCGVPKTTPFCTACGADASGAPGNIDTLVRLPNWGAFFLPGLWPFWHGSAWAGIAWWLFAGSMVVVPATGGILACVVAGYLLVWGNRIALSRRRFRDVSQFVHVERNWTRWGIAVFVACVAVAVAVYLDTPGSYAGTLR
jgi:hypothetical protein